MSEDVKFNCDVSDARYWGYFSICGLLMRYRDLFRSERGLDPWDPVDRTEIASWIQQKESRWPELETQEFRPIRLGAVRYHPFDVHSINEVLQKNGLLYGAGYGMYLKPTFFLAHLERTEQRDGHRIRFAGRELVRDLFSTAGMVQEQEIFIRLEPLSVLLWEKMTEARSRPASPLASAFAQWGLGDASAGWDVLQPRFESLIEHYAATLMSHELAESRESVPVWKDILSLPLDRDTEHFLRALKDLIADTSDSGTLKFLAARDDEVGLGLLVGMLDGYRRLLFPELRSSYDRFRADGWPIIESVRKNARIRLLILFDDVVSAFRGTAGDADAFRAQIHPLILAVRETP